MKAKASNIISGFVTKNRLDNIITEIKKKQSNIIEICGEHGAGKMILMKSLIEEFSKQKIPFKIFQPNHFAMNHFRDIFFSISSITEETFEKFLSEANELKIKNKFDLFYFLSTKLSEEKLLTSQNIIINEAYIIEDFTLDFISYLIQYFPDQQIKFIISTTKEISSYSTKIPLKLLQNDDIKLLIKNFSEGKVEDKDFTAEAELINRVTSGNIYAIAHILLRSLQGDKLEIDSYLDKKVSLSNVYLETFKEYSKSIQDILIYIFMTPGKCDIKYLKSLKIDQLEKNIKSLINEQQIYKVEDLYYVSNMFLTKNSYDSLPSARKIKFLSTIREKFGMNCVLKEFAVMHNIKFAELNEGIDYFKRVNDYESLRILYTEKIALTKDKSKKVETLIELGNANIELKKAETATENFREALRISVDNDLPAEQCVFKLANNLFSVNSLAFALEMIKKFSPSKIESYWEWKLLYLKANILMDMEKFDEALEVTDKVYNVTSNIEEKKIRYSMMGDTKKLRGLIYYYAYELEKAESEFIDAERHYINSNNIEGLAAIYNNLGGLSIAQGDWTKTEELYLKSLDYERKQYSLSGISGRYSNLGYLFDDESNYKKSLYYLNEALKIQLLLDDRDVLTNIYNNIGVTYMDNGKYAEAKKSFNSLLELGLKYNLYRNVIAALNNLGALHFKSGDWAAATDYYERAIKKSQENSFYEGLCKSYNNLGELYETRGEFNLALKCYTKSKDLLPNISDDFLKAELYGNLGSVYTCLHKFKEAYGYVVESYDFFKSLKAKDKMIEGAQKTALYFIETRNYESANYYLNQAEKVAEEIGSEFQLGKTFYYMSLVERENIKETEEFLKKAIQIFVKTNSNFDLAKANFEYANLLLKSDDWEQALQILEDNKKIIRSFDAIKFLEKNDIQIQTIKQKFASELSASKQQESLLEKFYDITQILNGITDFDILLNSALESLVEFAEADGGIFCLYHNKLVKDNWEYMIPLNLNTEEKNFATLLSLVEDSFNKNENQNVKQPHFAPNLNNIISFPLNVRSERKGVILLFTQHGSHYFTEKMYNLISALCNQIIVIVENISFSNLQKSHAVIREEIAAQSNFSNIIGKSNKIQEIFKIIDKIKDTPTTVLLEGPSGTGKELIARALHYNSNRRNKNFVAQYCGALPETLLESELFGHVKGSFTGASHDKKGLFEIADGGTFFLDEIADISLSTQAKLLRFLQEGEIKRVGAVKVERVNVRVICATNVSLKEKVDAGEFRLDLYYRLNVIRIEVPSLMERKSDIPLLAVHFLDKYSKKISKKVKGITDEAMRYLSNYDWPGNIRQLENEVERAVTLAESNSYINSPDLSDEIFRFKENTNTINLLETQSLKEAVEKLERQMITNSLEENNWNQTRTAKELGLSRQGLIKKMQRYKLER